MKIDLVETGHHEGDAPSQPRPCLHQHVMQPGARRRPRGVYGQRPRRRVVQQQHGVREQSVPGAEIDDAPAAEDPPNPPRHFPGLVQFLARQTAGMAHRARQPIEQRVARKAPEIAIGEPAF